MECTTKAIFSVKCITKVLYEMTLLYIKDRNCPTLAPPKWWTIQWDPKLACHPTALISYSEQHLFNKNVNVLYIYIY